MRTTITIDESRLATALQTISAGVLSALYVRLKGVPDYVQTLTLVIPYVNDDDEETAYAAPCTATSTDGEWTSYVIPAAFPNASSATLKYSVVGYDSSLNPIWLGTGRLDVLDNPAAGAGTLPTVIPEDTYVRNPNTGLYHKVSAVVDDEGNISLNVAEEGITR